MVNVKHGILAFYLIVLIALSLSACSGGGNSDDAINDNDLNNFSDSVVIDLSGGWKQSNSNSGSNYQIAMIAYDTIEIYWKSEDDNSMSLYWTGTCPSPTSETVEYSWDSVNDKSKTDRALLSSSDDKKTFTYRNGIISYTVSALGTTTTVELKKSDEVDISIDKTIPVSELLPLALVDSGYALKKGFDKFYIQYAIIVENPNTERGVSFPKVRITARDASGSVLATTDVVGMEIAPGTKWYSASQGPSTDIEPSTVDFEIIEPDDSDWITAGLLEYDGNPLKVENPVKRDDKIVGEILNPNNYDVDSIAVVILFRDEKGNLLAGETTYTDKINAGGRIPFELSLWTSGDYTTDNFEVHAYPW